MNPRTPKKLAPPAGDAYQPMMSAERARRIRAWHEEALRIGQREETVEIDYLGTSLIVLPNVFEPTPVSPLLGKAVLAEVRRGDRVLDLGTGSGVNAILAASKASEVVAVDVNPASIKCAKKNAGRNGVASHIKVLQSDLFENVRGRFDLIIFDPPFRWFKPRDVQERATTDENYRTLTAFFKQVEKHLQPGGRILLSFGTSGDINYLKHLVAQSGLRKRVLASKEHMRNRWRVKYYAYKLFYPAA